MNETLDYETWAWRSHIYVQFVVKLDATDGMLMPAHGSDVEQRISWMPRIWLEKLSNEVPFDLLRRRCKSFITNYDTPFTRVINKKRRVR